MRNLNRSFGRYGLQVLFVLLGLSFCAANSGAEISTGAAATGPKWVEKNVQVETDEKNPNVARKILLEKATEKVALDITKEVIGEAKYSRNLPLIQSHIVKAASQFVPVAKPGDLQPNGEGFKMSVAMKVNPDELQRLLLENGLFYESDFTPFVLPMISIQDRRHQTQWSWWKDNLRDATPFNLRAAQELETQLHNSLWKTNFLMQRPILYRWGDLALGPEYMAWTRWGGAAIVVEGEVVWGNGSLRADANELTVHLIAQQSKNNRAMGEVSRSYDLGTASTDEMAQTKLKEILPVVAADLGQQILDAWQKGSLGSELYRLVIEGTLRPTEMEQAKESLRRVHDFKMVRERLISASEVAFEIDTSLPPDELLRKHPKISVGGHHLRALKATDKELRYEWQDKGGSGDSE